MKLLEDKLKLVQVRRDLVLPLQRVFSIDSLYLSWYKFVSYFIRHKKNIHLVTETSSLLYRKSIIPEK
jgi:hypothetical protein